MLYIIYLHYFSKGIKYRFTYLTLMCNLNILSCKLYYISIDIFIRFQFNIINYFYYLKYKNSDLHLTAKVGVEHI
mgnify:CR=1 FL=1